VPPVPPRPLLVLHADDLDVGLRRVEKSGGVSCIPTSEAHPPGLRLVVVGNQDVVESLMLLCATPVQQSLGLDPK
jgi:hypothetical protein